MRHVIHLCYCFGYDVTVKGLLKRECSKPQGSTENDAKSNFLQNIYSEKVLPPYTQGVPEIPFKLHSFETPLRLMGQWTNSKICRTAEVENKQLSL